MIVKFFAGTTKQSAKGVTKDARKKLNHRLYKQSILSGETVRLINTRIASSKHQLQTIVVNKKSLSGYDDKRYILSDHVLTLPFGHKSLREEILFKMIEQDPDWGYESQSEIETETAHTPPVTHNIEADTHTNSSPPDPGFNQRNYSEDELNENVVDFDNLSEFSDSGSSTDEACDGFILSQAIEDSDSSPQPPITLDEQPPANLPITIEQQNLQDEPPTKKRRRARIIESTSEED